MKAKFNFILYKFFIDKFIDKNFYYKIILVFTIKCTSDVS